ncbi:phage antirepressor KilAC domain-containing protein [Pseudomonas rubra]|uniref:Phage antirepressor KilAC domain-containing protein n=1 Tax=Pseudomonas rubra TaxID=2942627 RepID=A0ABT5PFB1_9PSED|nr:phage antirepressor KilAC domain-containing protein [Pseudomonas rubra]MDD1016881.1 phage antirepressor KilAC domain-containing protein [Pseudomonas rubra]MDD1039373.1 phage antirepressor KilAC domain-containing protein [Pseudomonas rubra]MDD1157845.1 phage antirepressor KilAC domain-containing protein [Pseudomonas rubra]
MHQAIQGNTGRLAPRNESYENVARTMSSIELRDLINEGRAAAGEPKVRNDQFLARVEDELGDELKGVQKYYTPVYGNQVATYDLTLDQCMLVGMRESKAVRRSVLQKLKSMEAPRVIATLPDFSNPAAAARAWAEQFELQQAANQALAIAAPKVEFVDRYVEATGLKGFRQTSKLLRANEARFREFLLDKKIMYRMGGEWQAYQQHIDAGRFEVKTDTAENGHAFNQTKFTPKGVTWVAGLWAQYNLGEI